jgi:SAM-dependent methyltransferase
LHEACRNCRILDAGTNDGSLVQELRKRGFQAFGIDLLTHKEWGDLLWFSQQDMASTNFPSESFDLIYTDHSALSEGPPLVDRAKVVKILTEFRRILKPNGIIRVYGDDSTTLEVARQFHGLEIIDGPYLGEFALQKTE